MLTVNPEYRQERTVSMGVVVCYNAGTTSTECYHHGVAILSALDTLEAQGLRVELTVIDSAESSVLPGTVRNTMWRIKEACQPLDLDRLAFVLAHPAFLRRLCFRETERHAEDYAAYSLNYGRVHTYVDTDNQFDALLPPVGMINASSLEYALADIAGRVALQLGRIQ